ncbi:MAG: flavodoxin-dependent (E)-4-hydroxy-3-methylbut-2-enyl-diphosphate synthase [Candidatus Omnitrophica bacterium]|nr:flavodoxin-dependent (E)-4-hydroxy-3-methylbut-2-enyl-diphosphate synthase [Candidatus Omnitrophota bacterium]
MIKRRKTKTVNIGPVKIGSAGPISIQSMTKTDTRAVSATLRQIKQLQDEGCQIVRLAIKTPGCAQALSKIKAKTDMPLVADIHFDYRLALLAINHGVDAIRLNPGNINRKEEISKIAQAARKRKIPIRVGVNSGSLRPSAFSRQLSAKKVKTDRLADLMVKSALDYIKLLERFHFYDIIVSLKASDVRTTCLAYKKMAGLCRYPFHLGITAAGLPESGIVKSAAGLGALLLEGIGDTIRVSLTGDPRLEIRAAKNILQALDLGSFGPDIIACPTCGRTQVDLIKITQEVTRKLNESRTTPACRSLGAGKKHEPRKLKVAIMGCEVNGPGEAKEADIGIACGKSCAVLFKQGKVVRRIPASRMVQTLIKEINKKNE